MNNKLTSFLAFFLLLFAFTVNVSAIEKVWENLYELSPDDAPDSSKGRNWYSSSTIHDGISTGNIYNIQGTFMQFDETGQKIKQVTIEDGGFLRDIIELEDGSIRSVGISTTSFPGFEFDYIELDKDLNQKGMTVARDVGDVSLPLMYEQDFIIALAYNGETKLPYVKIYDLDLNDFGNIYFATEEVEIYQVKDMRLFRCDKEYIAVCPTVDTFEITGMRIYTLDSMLNLIKYKDLKIENGLRFSISSVNKNGEFIVSYFRYLPMNAREVYYEKYDFDLTKLWQTEARIHNQYAAQISESGALVKIESRIENTRKFNTLYYYTGAGVISDSLHYHIESDTSTFQYQELFKGNGETMYVASTHIAKGDNVDSKQYPEGYKELYLAKFDIVSSLSERVQQRAGIKVYPQPAVSGNTLNIDVSEAKGNISGIRLFDVNGVEISNFTMLDLSGGSISLQLPEIAKGVYYLKLSGINSDIVPIIVE